MAERTRTLPPPAAAAIVKLFSEKRACLERTEDGSFWAGLPNALGRMHHCRGGTIAEAVARAFGAGAERDGP